MRYPEFLKQNGTIGFVAPSFGCATQPYKAALITPFEGGAKQGITLTLVPIVMRTMALESAIRRRNAGRN